VVKFFGEPTGAFVERATFFERLRRSRLLSDAELEQTASRFGADEPAQGIAEALLKEGLLTPYQVRQLNDGDTQLLTLGQYRLLDELGRGGMGRVFKALHTIMGRVVAIKVIAPDLVSDPVAVEWFHREVRASTQLVHPNIVMAFDANEADGLHFLVMEYVQGVTLETLVKQHGPLPVEHACALMSQAALGLQHAHEKGMVHRDIKPGNLLIPLPQGEQPPEALVKILDFGLARLQGKNKGDTIALRGEAGLLGTPDYISPEQSRDIHSADIRSDLYSLGCAFYFALAGRVPFSGENAMEKLIKHLMEQPQPLTEGRPDVPSEIAAIIERLMAKEPAQRYQTPVELAEALQPWTSAGPRVASAPRTSNRPLWVPSPTKHPAPRPPTAEQPEMTRVLSNIEVFSPSERARKSSGASLLEQLCEPPQEEAQPRESLDTMPWPSAEEAQATATEAPAAASPSVSAEDKAKVEADGTEIELPAAPAPSAAAKRSVPPVDPVVARLWKRWSALIKLIVVGGGASSVNVKEYQTIHSMLLQACRAALEDANVPRRRALYEKMLSIAQPWLKLQAFLYTEPAILESLWQRCQQLQLEANNGKAPWAIRQIIGLLLLTFGSGGMTLWYLHYGRRWLPALREAFDGTLSMASLRSAWHFLQTHPVLLLGVIFPLVVICSIALLRPARLS
jgi:serine/threonine protein kinase